MFDDIVEEFPAFRILHDHVNRVARLYNLIQLNDVAMFDLLEDFNFASDPSRVRHLRNLAHLKNLNGDLLICPDVDSEFNFTESTLAQVSHHLVLPNLLQLPLRRLLSPLLIQVIVLGAPLPIVLGRCLWLLVGNKNLGPMALTRTVRLCFTNRRSLVPAANARIASHFTNKVGQVS